MLVGRRCKRFMVVASACALMGTSLPVHAVNLTQDRSTNTLEKDSDSGNSEQNVSSGTVLSKDGSSQFERSNEILNRKFLVQGYIF